MPRTWICQNYESSERELAEPLGKTNETAGDFMSLEWLVKLMIRRISGKADPAAISHLEVNNGTIEQPGEIADILASTIAHISSSDHYTDRFQRLKAREEKKQIRFSSINLESYNKPFTMQYNKMI